MAGAASTTNQGETNIENDSMVVMNEYDPRKKGFSCFGGKDTLETLRLSPNGIVGYGNAEENDLDLTFKQTSTQYSK